MKRAQNPISRRWAPLLMAALLMFGIVGTAFADVVDRDVRLTIHSLSDGARQSAAITGKYDEDNSTLYIPAEVIFAAVGGAWVVRDGSVYFPVGHAVASVGTLVEGDIVYVPALETLTKLGVPRGLGGNELNITVW